MSEYVNIVKVASVEQTTAKNGKDIIITLNYEHVAGNFKGQVWPIKGLAVGLKKNGSLDVLLKAKPGDLVVMDKTPYEYQNAKGETKTGYNLTRVAIAADKVAKPIAVSTKASITPTTTATQYTKDETGIKVGAARNQALAFLAATKGKSFSLDDVDTVAYEIVVRQGKQEDAVRNNKNPFNKTTTEQEDYDQDLDPLEYEEGPDFN